MSDPFEPVPVSSLAPASSAGFWRAGWLGSVLGVVMAMALTGIILMGLRDDRAEARAKAEQASANLSNALSRDIARNIQLFRFVLFSLRDTVMAPGFTAIPEPLRHKVLFAHTALPREMGVLFITDAAGTVVMDSDNNAIRDQSRAWRPYYQHHKQNNDPGLHITGPFDSATSGDPVIVMSVRINNPDGSFGGMVVASLLLTYFDGLFANIELGDSASMTLFLHDGIILARTPRDNDAIGRDLRLDSRLQAAATSRFSVVEEIDPDQGGRLVISTQVDDLPLRLQLVQPLDNVYRNWDVKLWTIGGTAGTLFLGTLLLIVLIHREGQRRLDIQRALADANARLAQMAVTDALTGIANRRRFDEAFRQEQARSSRAPHETALLMLDIDLFKQFNDIYGHEAGDAALRAVAQAAARSVTRATDLVARIGGEEFAALLTETDLGGALSVADRIREAVAALGIHHSGSPHGHVTISIGVAGTHGTSGSLSVDQLFAAADEALYQAKAAGRDRIMLYKSSAA